MQSEATVAERLSGRVRSLLVRARAAFVYALPARWRGAVVSRLPERMVPGEMRPEYFDRLYGLADDPFGFDSNVEEQLKFDHTLRVCGEGSLGSVLEIGCAVGTFTRPLAARASRVLAIDVSARAVELASTRLADQPHVSCEVRALPREFPECRFDLVIASDVLYYLSTDELTETLVRVERALEPRGRFVIVHFRPRMGSVLSGDEVHDIVVERTGLDHDLAERCEFGEGRPYRVDRFVKR